MKEAIGRGRSTTLALAVALLFYVSGCGQSAPPLDPTANSGIPSNIHALAQTALTKAKSWQPDAELVAVAVQTAGGSARTSFSFKSNSTSEGFSISNDGPGQPTVLNSQYEPFPSAQYIDLPQAVEAAHRAGMGNSISEAELLNMNGRFIWHLTEQNSNATGAQYDINPIDGTMLPPAIQNASDSYGHEAFLRQLQGGRTSDVMNLSPNGELNGRPSKTPNAAR